MASTLKHERWHYGQTLYSLNLQNGFNYKIEQIWKNFQPKETAPWKFKQIRLIQNAAKHPGKEY